MAEVFLLCRECWVLHSLSSTYEVSSNGVVSEEAAIAYGQFLLEHRYHPMERVERHTTREHHSGSLSDPMRKSWIEVSNGNQLFTVRTYREAVELPRVREVVDQRIEEGPILLTVEEPLVRRALEHHFHPYALRPTKVDGFLSAIHQALAVIEGEDLEIEFDDAEDPSVSIAALPEYGRETLLARCRDIFQPWELARLASFVTANCDEYGALALRIRRESHLQPL